MKKIVVSLCLLYAANSSAGVTKLIMAVTAPVTIPATYYAYKTLVEWKKIDAMDGNSPELKSVSPERIDLEKHVLRLNANSFSQYLDGAVCGMAPFINIVKLAEIPEFGRPIKTMPEAEKTGFYAGLSLYPTYAATLCWLKYARKIK